MTAVQTIERCCPACDGRRRRPLPQYSEAPWEMVACAECGFVHLAQAPAYEELSTNLAWEKTSKAESARRKRKSPLLQRLSRATRFRLHLFRPDEQAFLARVLPAGKVLDIGCGGDVRVPEGHTPFGIEISEGLCATADARMRARGGRAVHAPALEGLDAFEDGAFSGILMRSFLEHEAQPRQVLERAFRKLAPGGVAYVRVPNYGSLNRRVMGRKWCGFRLPDHLNYFTNEQLRAMAERIGYRYRLVNPLNLHTNDNINALLIKPD